MYTPLNVHLLPCIIRLVSKFLISNWLPCPFSLFPFTSFFCSLLFCCTLLYFSFSSISPFPFLCFFLYPSLFSSLFLSLPLPFFFPFLSPFLSLPFPSFSLFDLLLALRPFDSFPYPWGGELWIIYTSVTTITTIYPAISAIA